ncbi:MAG: hypothetical protein U9R48_07040 [Chloroflexota bacterium]|nr:hypothetical protein [Chloroflexota bacterium]
MKTAKERLNHLFQSLQKKQETILAVLLALAVLLTLSWSGRVILAPARHAGPTVDLTPYGVSGIMLRLTYPSRLGEEQRGDNAPFITAFARARSPEDVQPFSLIFDVSDGSVAFVDAEGGHVPGRLDIVPGYPQALPYDLRIAHANTQLRGGLLSAHRVSVAPSVLLEGAEVPVPELGFGIRLPSRVERVARNFFLSFSRAAMPYFLLALVLAVALLAWRHRERQGRLEQEKRLSTLYGQLREQIKLEQWEKAREKIDQIRLLQPHYRDIDNLDARVGVAQTAAWRRKRLYEAGVEAYEARDWPVAVRHFAAIEAEEPYYRDVRFLKRTAALYADLGSRDRSLRLAAARELGDVGDLVDAAPLLEALGDHSEEVADAAEASFERVGLRAFDVLLEGLVDRSPSVQERSYRLIRHQGQDAKSHLLVALRSSDPRITERVASLLIDLGAREELAEALLWIGPRHQGGIVKALVSEGAGVCSVLIETLLEAPPERRQVVLNALAALKSETDISRHLERALHSAEGAEHKRLLQRALDLPPTNFHVSDDVPQILQLPPHEEADQGNVPQEDRSWWQKLFDRGNA